MLWIVHPDPRIQRFLARLAGERDAICGAEGDPIFESSAAPRAIVLGVAEPIASLDFVHRMSTRHPAAHWILVGDVGVGEAELEERFSGLDAVRLGFPPEPAALRGALRRAAAGEAGQSLPERRRREAVASRFARYFQDLALPPTDEVQLAGRGLVVRGERGTGRLLFARAAHLLAGGEPFVHLPCHEGTRPEALLERLAGIHDAQRPTICLEGLDHLSAGLQHELIGWIELGVPGTSLTPSTGADAIRWIALISEHGALLPELADALAAFEVHLPPLRERPDAIRPFVLATAEQWAAARGLERRLAPGALDRLAAEAWPGNLRELESAVLRLLAGSSGPEIDLGAVEALLGIAPGAPKAPLARSAVPGVQGAPPPPAPRVERDPAGVAGVRPAPARREPAPEPRADDRLAPLAAALAHELRNPLVSIRTFAELLPERFTDPEFRTSFREHVRRDVQLLEERVSRLSRLAELGPGDRKPVDVTGLLERLLEERRSEINARRLLVLRELETDNPFVMGDAERLGFVFDCLLSAALRGSSERADLYLASHHHANSEGSPVLRILFRFHEARAHESSRPGVGDALRPLLHSLDLRLAESALRGADGSLRVDAGSADETVVVIDLPATREP